MRERLRLSVRTFAASMFLLAMFISYPAAAHEKWFTNSTKFPIA